MPPPLDEAARAAMPTLATKTDADGSVWHLKVNDPLTQVWLSEDGQRVQVCHWGDDGPRFVREE